MYPQLGQVRDLLKAYKKSRLNLKNDYRGTLLS